MSARDELLDEYGRADTAPLGTLAELRQKLNAICAEVLRDVDARLAAMQLPEHLKGTLNAWSYVDARQHCRDVVEDMAKEAGKVTPTGGEITQPAELTIYRASHESIVMGRYTNRNAARKHCETVLRRELGEDVFLGWVPDHGGDDAPEELCIGEDFECSGYVVTPLAIASEYDEEADE
jgi:hypothetical protein